MRPRNPIAIVAALVAFAFTVPTVAELAREIVERHIAVVGVDDPVSPAPHDAFAVGLVSARVGITRPVEPARGHPLAEAGRSEQAVDDLPIGVGRWVVEEGVDLSGRGR